MAVNGIGTMVASTRARWMAVGHSADPDGRRAGQAAAHEALCDDAKLLIVFCSDAYDLEALLSGIRECSGDVPLIGCSTAGEIAANGPGDKSVVVAALGGSGFTVVTRAATDASGQLRDAGAAVAQAARCLVGHRHQVLMILSDGLAGDQQEIVRGAYGVVGAAMPLVGGCAGDDLKMRATYQFHGDRVLSNAVVGAAIASDAPMGIGVRHGWRRVGEPMVVTRSANNRVHLLEYLFASRWPEGFVCPGCGGTRAGAETRRRLWICTACGLQTSVRDGDAWHADAVADVVLGGVPGRDVSPGDLGQATAATARAWLS